MKIFIKTTIAFIFCITLNNFTRCSELVIKSDSNNAALYYKEAALIFKQTNPKYLSLKQQDKYIDEFYVYYPIKDIQNVEKLFELFRKGCNQKKCVWGTEFSREGFFTTLHSTTDANNLSNFISSAIIEKFLNGNHKEAIELLLGNLILAKHIAEEQCLINFIIACRKQEVCIKIANKILDKLNSQELKRLNDGFNLQPQLPQLADVVLAERNILVTWIKNNPEHFLQSLESMSNPLVIESSSMIGYKMDNVPSTKAKIKKAKQKLKHVDYAMIDKYYKKLSDSTRMINKNNFDADIDIYNEIKKLPDSITKKILLNMFPSLKNAYELEQSLKFQTESFKSNINNKYQTKIK
jgi:hypothetical protein